MVGTLIVGGGIDTEEKALETLTAGANAIVVGNTLYGCQESGDYTPFYSTIEGALKALEITTQPG